MNPVKESILVADATQTDLATLLQLVGGLSRNHYLAQAQDARGNVLGEIEVKGGMVLSARVQGLQGKEAVYALLSLKTDCTVGMRVNRGRQRLPRSVFPSIRRTVVSGSRCGG